MSLKKSILRKVYLEKRNSLSPQDYQRRNEQLAQRCLDFLAQHPYSVVHSFLPITQKKEPDTWPIIQGLQSRGITVVVSKSDLKSNLLYHYPLSSETLLQPNRWGIPEPVAGEEEFPVGQIEAVLVPLLAFDQNGHRVGYGKGYYDRFLIQCQPDALKIGLSLEPPVSAIEDVDEALDVRLHHCITPDKVWSFQG